MILLYTLLACSPTAPQASCEPDEIAQLFDFVRAGVQLQTGPLVIEDQESMDGLEPGGGTGAYTYGYYQGEGALQGIDFDQQVVFLYPWVDGGCNDGPSYAVCLAGDTLTARPKAGKDGGCEAYYPQADYLVVDRGTATTAVWGTLQ